MKKLLSILLVISTLFLSIGLQTCFASKQSDYRYYDDFSDSQCYAENKKLKKRLKEAKIREAELEREIERKESKNKSTWAKIKSNLSFFFSSMVGKSLAVLSFVGVGLGAYSTLAAGYNCIVDPDCKFVNAENGNSFFSKFKEVNFKDAFDRLYKIALEMIENTYTVKTENEEN